MLHSKCLLEDHTPPLATPPDSDTDVSVCHQWSDGAVEEKEEEEERVMVVIVVWWHVWWWLTIQQAFPRSAILTWRDGKISSLVWSSLEVDSFLCLPSSVRLSVPDKPISRSLCSTSGTWVSCESPLTGEKREKDLSLVHNATQVPALCRKCQGDAKIELISTPASRT